MRIVVCIKQVPTVADLRFDEGRWTLMRQGVPSRINPHDLQALEAALTLKDEYGGEVLALSMGPPQSEEALREAVAMGVDDALLLSDRALSGADTLATALVLGRAISLLDPFPDVVLCGARSSDSSTGQVGPQIAEDLTIPHVAYVESIRSNNGTITVQRRVDRYRETIRVRMPALLTILSSPTRPRDVAMVRIEEAFNDREIPYWGLDELGLEANNVGLAGSATWVRLIREPKVSRSAHLVEGSPEEAVDAILKALKDRHIME